MLLVLCLSALTGPDAKAASTEPAIRESIDVMRRTVEVVVSPRSTNGFACETLRPEDLIAFEKGRKARVTAVDLSKPPRSIVLAVDASGSIPEYYWAELNRALQDLPSRLDPDDELAIVVFSDGVWIPFGPVRAAAMPAIRLPDQRTVGRSPVASVISPCLRTSLVLDGMLAATRLVASRDAPGVLVVISDGQDVGSQTSWTDLQRLLAAQTGTYVTLMGPRPSMASISSTQTAAGIGAELSMNGDLGSTDGFFGTRDFGGSRHFSQDPRESLDVILREMSIIGQVTYAVEDHAESALRPVPRILANPGIPCEIRVVDRVSRESTALASRRTSAPNLQERAAVSASLREHGLGAISSSPVSALDLRLASPLLDARDATYSAWAVSDPGWLLTRGTAIVVDAGTVAGPDFYRHGRLTPTRRCSPMLVERPIAVRVPPARFVRDRLATLADALLLLVRDGVASARTHPDWPAVPSAVVMEGKSFLEWSSALSDAICASWADWKALAAQEREIRIQSETERILGSPPHLAPRAALLEVDRAVRARALCENRYPDSRMVGGILGDVHAQRLFADLDGRMAGSVLKKAAHRSSEEAWLASEFTDIWERVTSWIPPSAPVHTLVPMIPSFDPSQGRIGFWRVVLPLRDRLPGAPLATDFLPESPLAAKSVSVLLDVADAIGVEIRGSLVGPIAYSARRSNDVRARFTLEPSEHPGEGLDVRARFDRSVPTPGTIRLDLRCVALEGPSATTDALEAELRRRGMLCKSRDLEPPERGDTR